jgi:hypothetical protein
LGLERGSLSLVSTMEELLGKNSSGFGIGNRGDPLRWPRDTLCARIDTNFSLKWRSLGRYSLLAD